jgi:hypothetical protein
MVCPSCGAQIDNPGKFCAKCGAQLPETLAPVPPPSDFAAVPPPPSEEPPAPPPWEQAPVAPEPAAPVEAPAAPVWAETPSAPPAAPIEAPAPPAWAQAPSAPPAAPPAWPPAPVAPAAVPPAPPAWPQPGQQVAPPPQAGAPQYAAPPYGVPQGAPQYPPQYQPQYGGPQYGAQYAGPQGALPVAAPAATGAGMLAPLLALAGGAVAVGSAWLPWAVTKSGDSLIKPIEQTGDTSDLANGYYLVAAGAVAAVCGLILLLGLVKTASSRSLMSIGAIAGGAVVLAVELVAYNHVNDLTTRYAIASIGYGLYVGVGAGVAAAVGGLLGFASKR